ncbi:MAG: universal stress protein [Acidobacteriota bacterium]
MFRKILVPVDFNELARRPLEIGLELARVGEGKVVLLSVIDDAFPNPDILSFQLPWADYHRHLRDEAQRRLESLIAAANAGSRVEACVVRGNPARMIAHFAEEEGFDLIVMATHGASGLHHALVGSVTRKVLHLAACPVLVVRLGEATTPSPAPAR